MVHIPGHDRSQMLLLPEAVDDYVAADNPVRFIEAFVDGLGHRGGDRHRRRFIRLAPTGWAATRNSAVCALTGHSGRPSQRPYR